jgi:hypothetical protein
MPFLDKVAAASAALQNPAARQEAVRLTSDQKERWNRIRELLEGASAESEPGQTESNTISSSDQVEGVEHEIATRRAPAFTVGSLRPRPGS